MIKKKLAIFIMATIFIFSAMIIIAQTPELNQETQELTQEYMKLNQELEAIQQEAYNEPEIKEIIEELIDLKDKKMIEIDSQAKEYIIERNEIEQNFQKAQNSGNQEKMEELQEDYKELYSKLQPLEQQVMQEEKVQEKQQEVQTTIMQKMQEIDPKTNDKIQRLNEIQQKLQQNQ